MRDKLSQKSKLEYKKSLFVKAILCIIAVFVMNLNSSAAAKPVKAKPQNRPNIGVLSEVIGGFWVISGRGVPENIVFPKWELNGKVYSYNTITKNRRIMGIGKISLDGEIVESSDSGVLRGRARPDGCVVLFGTVKKRASTEEICKISPDKFSVSANYGNFQTVAYFNRVGQAEALDIARRLYPAEYKLDIPAQTPIRPMVSADKTKRFALVIGISNYLELPVLRNPQSDAKYVAGALTRSGYDVKLLIDPNKNVVESSLNAITAKLSKEKNGAILIYYAGHGIEVDGKNYLIPVDTKLDPLKIQNYLLSLNNIIARISKNRNLVKILILDACRNAPVKLADAGEGLAQISAPEGTFVAYSTAPGMVASDGSGEFSPFAEAFVSQIAVKEQPIEATFRGIRKVVLNKTGGEQTPWDSSSLLDQFYLAR